MAEEVVGTIVGKLSTAAINRLGLLLGVRGDMKYIKDQLNVMRAYLRDAEETQDTDPRARTWVVQVQELAYDAEDCIDEFMFHLSQPTAHGLTGALQRCTRCLRTLKERHLIVNQVQDLKSRIGRAEKIYGPNGTTTRPSSHVATIPAQPDPRLAALFVEEAELVGIDEPKEKLLQWLTTKKQPHLSVISVVGMGGLGKTTLVRKVYESQTLSKLFQRRAWITVSKFQIKDLLSHMILQLQIISRREIESLRLEELIEVLKDHLKNKRYLVVFDDIWTTSAWEIIKLALPDSRYGSRVVVTTRIEIVANTCSSAFQGHVYKHQPLSHEQSWDLFSNKVFKGPKDDCPPDLKDLSDAILQRCGGLPLAIVTIAGLLASKPNKTREEWRGVHDRLGLELQTNPELGRVKQILNLSYNDLPYDLRYCFLYLSKYPEDYEIKRGHVVKLWVAEGFARRTNGFSAEEVAERNFDEFINRSMIQPSKVSCDGKVKSCRVHDVMLEVIVSKSREQNLVSSLLGEHGTASMLTSEQKIRRLSAHTTSLLEPADLSHLRSITMFGRGEASFVSPRLRLLRILDLEGDVSLGDQQLNWIGKLVHLRYVNIEPRGFELPESWGNLRELETLNIRSKVRLTRVTRLQRLRYLQGSRLTLPDRGIANLKALQTLDSVYCGKGQGQVMKEIGKLTQLRRLSLSHVAPENASHLSTSLEKLNSCLRSLKIQVKPKQVDAQHLHDCLESISRPPLQLQKLALYGHLKKLPSWIGFLKDHVAKITFRHTELEDDAIKVLQDLPHLIHLKLRYNSYLGEHLRFAREGFPRLRILLLGKSKSMKSLTFEKGAMPHLRRLAINFHKFSWGKPMESNVEFYGIEHLPGLKELDLRGVPKDAADILLQAMETHPNHPRVTFRETFSDIMRRAAERLPAGLLQAAENPTTPD